ncbi:MAG: hypothetical protein WKF71_12265 [Pyrinomonadaceae bacterium]
MKLLKKLAALFCLFIIVSNFTITRAQRIDNLDSYNEPPSRLRGVIEKFSQDYGSLNRFYTAPTSANRLIRFKQFYSDHLAFLNKQNFNALNRDEQIDYLLFTNYLAHEGRELDRNSKQLEEISVLLPFAKTISDLEDARRKLESTDSAKTAGLLNDLNKQIVATQKNIEENQITKPKTNSSESRRPHGQFTPQHIEKLVYVSQRL